MHLFCWESGENHTDHDDDAAKVRWCSASWNGELHPITGGSKASSTRIPVEGQRVQLHAWCVVGSGYACVLSSFTQRLSCLPRCTDTLRFWENILN